MADKINVMLTEEEVDARIREMGAQITKDYEGKELVLICTLKGAVFFACELAKRIDLPSQMEFMRCESYGSGTYSSGNIKLLLDLDQDIAGKHVLVVEDIVDTGRTLSYLLEKLKNRKPASLKLVALLDKPDRRVVDIKADYTGFTIPDKFVVGYGLDYAQNYRQLPFVGIIEPE